MLNSLILDVKCSRQELFNVLHKHINSELSEKLEIVRKHVSEKLKRDFSLLHPDNELAVKNLFTVMKSKWNESNRTTERFLNKNAEWIGGTIKLKVKIIQQLYIKIKFRVKC